MKKEFRQYTVKEGQDRPDNPAAVENQEGGGQDQQNQKDYTPFGKEMDERGQPLNDGKPEWYAKNKGQTNPAQEGERQPPAPGPQQTNGPDPE